MCEGATRTHARVQAGKNEGGDTLKMETRDHTPRWRWRHSMAHAGNHPDGGRSTPWRRTQHHMAQDAAPHGARRQHDTTRPMGDHHRASTRTRTRAHTHTRSLPAACPPRGGLATLGQHAATHVRACSRRPPDEWQGWGRIEASTASRGRTRGKKCGGRCKNVHKSFGVSEKKCNFAAWNRENG